MLNATVNITAHTIIAGQFQVNGLFDLLYFFIT
jgi:hypothetical protein